MLIAPRSTLVTLRYEELARAVCEDVRVEFSKIAFAASLQPFPAESNVCFADTADGAFTTVPDLSGVRGGLENERAEQKNFEDTAEVAGDAEVGTQLAVSRFALPDGSPERAPLRRR